MVHDAKEVILDCGYIALNFLFLMQQPFSLPHRANLKAIEINTSTPTPTLTRFGTQPKSPHLPVFLENFYFFT